MRLLAIVLLSWGVLSSALAEEFVGELGGGREQVRVPVPTGWLHVFQEETPDAGRRIDEFVPAGADIHDWPEMLTVHQFKIDPDQRPGAVQLAQQFVSAFLGACGQERIGTDIAAGLRNNYDAAGYWLACVTLPEARELENVDVRALESLAGMVVVGDQAIYHVQRAWHRDLPPDNTMSPEVLEELSAAADEGSLFVGQGWFPCNLSESDHPCGVDGE